MFAEIAGNVPVFVKFYPGIVIFKDAGKSIFIYFLRSRNNVISAPALGRNILGQGQPHAVCKPHGGAGMRAVGERSRALPFPCKTQRRGTRKGQAVKNRQTSLTDLRSQRIEGICADLLRIPLNLRMVRESIGVDLRDGRPGQHVMELIQKQQLPALAQTLRRIGKAGQEPCKHAEILRIVQTRLVFAVAAFDARL